MSPKGPRGLDQLQSQNFQFFAKQFHSDNGDPQAVSGLFFAMY